MRAEPSVLHLDLDAFFAAVEQRDKPSLQGKPVVIGGVSNRSVVSTASYEARKFGIHSAMPTHEARSLCPSAAILSGRFTAYRIASRQVMGVLEQLSPLVEPLSLDEAFVDLAAGGVTDFSSSALTALGEKVRQQVVEVTGGLTASVGFGSSKFMAKLACEEAKPDGVSIIEPGTEVDHIQFLSVRVLPGVGPATAERLAKLGIRVVDDLRHATVKELQRELGQAHASWLMAVAYGEDDRQISGEREVKSISMEDTFETDLTTVEQLAPIAARDAVLVAGRLRKSGFFARTITVKLKLADFTIHSRSRTLLGAIDFPETIASVALALLEEQRALLKRGVRLLGVGVSGFTLEAQEALFEVDLAHSDISQVELPSSPSRHSWDGYRPGDDVTHDEYGPGWVWGSGLGLVTVRFETAETGPGPIKTLSIDDPLLRPTPVQLPPDPDGESSGPGWVSGDGTN
ncbi:MAG: DNA polymerase IV [Propionibacteriaceae bacterium]|nr:DNA polymerase IV [Propionibacteriaceae bacterium]